MAIITEEPDTPNSPQIKKTKHKPPSPPQPTSSTPNPFTFWFYFTISVSILTLTSVTISNLTTNQDPKTWFLTLPTNLRNHYSTGRIIKVQPTPNSNPVEVFTIQNGALDSPHKVLIVHGLGCSSYTFSKILNILGETGVHAVAIDLPGSGFSDKSETVTYEKEITGFDRFLEMYNEIKEKGIFWGFDQLVEQGYVNYDYPDDEIRVVKVTGLKPVGLGPEEMGRVLGQVIETMGFEKVDLVLHDSAFNLGANWVAKNLGLVRSVTVIDGLGSGYGFPLWVLKVPVVREVVCGFGFVFEKVVRSCCVRGSGVVDLESHRVLLKGRDGIKAVVEMGDRMNSSFDVGEWGKLDGVRSLPMQVVWSEEWIEKGRQVAETLPQATFVTHSGGSWPQDDTADELAESIHEFVSRLPKPIKASKKKEPVPEHIRELLDEATTSVHHHGFGGHDHSHSHGHGHSQGEEVAYPSGYGLGHEF